ncbi:MAG TPA: TadE/TadG family type IV pilus assembly protein [Acidobacteriota bacterium]|nr:TadE/TadG family type IV pilus assembly protein [Acidobacteriota bacterium]
MPYNRNRNERGTSTVEGALVLIAFFVILFGIMEMGRIVSVYQTMTDAVREGARLAIAPTAGTSTLPSSAAVQAEVERFLASNGIQGASISVNPATTPSGDTATEVTVSYDYNVITLSMFSDATITLNAGSTMRNETSP